MINEYHKAYLHNKNTVVLDKSQIHNAKDDEFREITLFIPHVTCKYTLWDEDTNTYECSSCGILWSLSADSPNANGMSYCPGCGRKIKEVSE